MTKCDQLTRGKREYEGICCESVPCLSSSCSLSPPTADMFSHYDPSWHFWDDAPTHLLPPSTHNFIVSLCNVCNKSETHLNIFPFAPCSCRNGYSLLATPSILHEGFDKLMASFTAEWVATCPTLSRKAPRTLWTACKSCQVSYSFTARLSSNRWDNSKFGK